MTTSSFDTSGLLGFSLDVNSAIGAAVNAGQEEVQKAVGELVLTALSIAAQVSASNTDRAEFLRQLKTRLAALGVEVNTDETKAALAARQPVAALSSGTSSNGTVAAVGSDSDTDAIRRLRAMADGRTLAHFADQQEEFLRILTTDHTGNPVSRDVVNHRLEVLAKMQDGRLSLTTDGRLELEDRHSGLTREFRAFLDDLINHMGGPVTVTNAAGEERSDQMVILVEPLSSQSKDLLSRR